MSYLEKASRSWQIHSRPDSHWITLRFFFDFRADSGLANDLEGFLRSLLFQILKQNPSSEDELHQLEEKYGNYKSGTWTSSALKEAFVNALRQIMVNTCILIDGLDEFSGNMHELMTLFHKIPSRTNTGHLVKICLASRPEPVIAMALGDKPGLQMQARNTEAIKRYAFTTMEKWGVAADQRRNFSADIAKKAEGVFLWARFAVMEIIDGSAEGEFLDELYRRLEALPSDMEELYAYIFKRMNSKDHEEARLMFQLVCFAEGTHEVDTINLRQLKEAVAILQDDISGFGQHDSVEGLERFRKRVKAKCGGLLEEIFYERDFEADCEHHGCYKHFDDEIDEMSLESDDDSQASDVVTERIREHYNKNVIKLEPCRRRGCYNLSNDETDEGDDMSLVEFDDDSPSDAATEPAQEHYNKNGGMLKLIHRTAKSYLDGQGWFSGLKSAQISSPHALWLHACCRSIQSELGSRKLQAVSTNLIADVSDKSSLLNYAFHNLFLHARLMESKYQQSSFPFLESLSPMPLRYLQARYMRELNQWLPTEVDFDEDHETHLTAIEEGFDRQPLQIIVEQILPLSLRDAVLRDCYTPLSDGEDIYLALLASRSFDKFDDRDEELVQQLVSYLIELGAVVSERHIVQSLTASDRRAGILDKLLASWPKEKIRLRRHLSLSKHLGDQEHGDSVGVLCTLVRIARDLDFEAKLVLLLERGESLDEICVQGYAALHACIICSHHDQLSTRERTRLILKHGANPNICGPRGTPLQLAWRTFRSMTVDKVEVGHYECQTIMTLLLDNDANASWVEPNGLSINSRIIEAWCDMSPEEMVARWEDDDYPYCISTWDTYEFPLYHTRKQLKIHTSDDTLSPPRKRRR